jgi:regulator of nucleoside diphosphate kinase
MEQPAITLSELDHVRIERLLERAGSRHQPAADALRDELDRAHVLAPEDMPATVVTMNSTVRFADDSSRAEFVLKLVYPEAAASPDTVSVLAPIGSALLGMSVGQSIEWQVPGGRKLQLRVLEIVHQPEAAGDYLS